MVNMVRALRCVHYSKLVASGGIVPVVFWSHTHMEAAAWHMYELSRPLVCCPVVWAGATDAAMTAVRCAHRDSTRSGSIHPIPPEGVIMSELPTALDTIGGYLAVERNGPVVHGRMSEIARGSSSCVKLTKDITGYAEGAPPRRVTTKRLSALTIDRHRRRGGRREVSDDVAFNQYYGSARGLLSSLFRARNRNGNSSNSDWGRSIIRLGSKAHRVRVHALSSIAGLSTSFGRGAAANDHQPLTDGGAR